MDMFGFKTGWGGHINLDFISGAHTQTVNTGQSPVLTWSMPHISTPKQATALTPIIHTSSAYALSYVFADWTAINLFCVAIDFLTANPWNPQAT